MRDPDVTAVARARERELSEAGLFSPIGRGLRRNLTGAEQRQRVIAARASAAKRKLNKIAQVDGRRVETDVMGPHHHTAVDQMATELHHHLRALKPGQHHTIPLREGTIDIHRRSGHIPEYRVIGGGHHHDPDLRRGSRNVLGHRDAAREAAERVRNHVIADVHDTHTHVARLQSSPAGEHVPVKALSGENAWIKLHKGEYHVHDSNGTELSKHKTPRAAVDSLKSHMRSKGARFLDDSHSDPVASEPHVVDSKAGRIKKTTHGKLVEPATFERGMKALDFTDRSGTGQQDIGPEVGPEVSAHSPIAPSLTGHGGEVSAAAHAHVAAAHAKLAAVLDPAHPAHHAAHHAARTAAHAARMFMGDEGEALKLELREALLGETLSAPQRAERVAAGRASAARRHGGSDVDIPGLHGLADYGEQKLSDGISIKWVPPFVGRYGTGEHVDRDGYRISHPKAVGVHGFVKNAEDVPGEVEKLRGHLRSRGLSESISTPASRAWGAAQLTGRSSAQAWADAVLDRTPSMRPFETLHPRGRGGKFRSKGLVRQFTTASGQPPSNKTLHAEWANLDRDLLPFAGHPNAPEARKIISRQKEITRELHHRQRRPGKVGGPVRDVVVVGSGPAGMTAGIYGASEGLDTVMIDAHGGGGQAGLSSRIENFEGFPAGVTGRQLAKSSREQAERLGAEEHFDVSATALHVNPDGTKTVDLSDGSSIRARVVVMAGGVQFRHVGIPGANARGVVYGDSTELKRACGTRPAIIVGGANSAGQAAIDAATGGRHVEILIRGPSIEAKMSDYLVQQLRSDPNITIRENSEIGRIENRRGHVSGVVLKSGERLPAGGVGLFIGSAPDTGWTGLAHDQRGYLAVGGEGRGELETNVPGVYAAGDIRAGSVHRVITAAADGAHAIALSHDFISQLGPVKEALASDADDDADRFMDLMDLFDRGCPDTGFDDFADSSV